MKIAVGAFVIVFTLLFAGIAYAVLLKKGLFDEKTPFHFYTDSAETIYIGMPVRYSGFEIGNLTEIVLTEGGKVHVRFSVNNLHLKWIRTSSVLQLEKPLIGSPAINVITTLETPPAAADAILPFVVRDDINVMVRRFEPVMKSLQHIASALEIVLGELSEKKDVFFHTLQNMEILSERLVNEKALLTGLTGDANTTAVFKDTVVELNALVKKLHTEIISPSGTRMQQVDVILLDIQHKLRTIDGTVNAVGDYEQTLIDLRSDIRTGIEKTDRLLNRMDAMTGTRKPAAAVMP